MAECLGHPVRMELFSRNRFSEVSWLTITPRQCAQMLYVTQIYLPKRDLNKNRSLIIYKKNTSISKITQIISVILHF